MSESLEGKVAVISGVASGFAKATAELFAAKGCGLVMFDLNQAGLDGTVEVCRGRVEGGRLPAATPQSRRPSTGP